MILFINELTPPYIIKLIKGHVNMRVLSKEPYNEEIILFALKLIVFYLKIFLCISCEKRLHNK